MLQEKVEKLPKNIPTGKKTGPLAGYCCNSMELTKKITADVDIWKVWDQTLNVLIPHRISDIYPLITWGKYGLIILVKLMEHLVYDHNIDKGLLEGKVGCVIEAIDGYIFLPSVYSFTDDFNSLSICKQ